MSYPYEWNGDEIPKVYLDLIRGLLTFFESSESDGTLVEGHIRRLREHGVNPGLARPGLRWLTDHKILYQNEEDYDGGTNIYWTFTQEGAEFAYENVLHSVQKPPDNATWEPLPVEFGSKVATDLLVATNDLLEKVRSDNQLGANQPVLRDRLLGSLNAGKMLLEQRIISRAELKALLLAPASWLVETFPKALVAAGAKLLIDLVIKLLS